MIAPPIITPALVSAAATLLAWALSLGSILAIWLGIDVAVVAVFTPPPLPIRLRFPLLLLAAGAIGAGLGVLHG